jgi:hypothetical protein
MSLRALYQIGGFAGKVRSFRCRAARVTAMSVSPSKFMGRKFSIEQSTVKTLNERLPVSRYGDVAFIIDGAAEFENRVWNIALGPDDKDCATQPRPRRIELSTTIPIGMVRPRTRCPRCLAGEYPAIDAALRELNGQPPAGPEPASPPPPGPTPEEIARRTRDRLHHAVMVALLGQDESGRQIDLAARAEKLLGIVAQIVTNG